MNRRNFFKIIAGAAAALFVARAPVASAANTTPRPFWSSATITNHGYMGVTGAIGGPNKTDRIAEIKAEILSFL